MTPGARGSILNQEAYALGKMLDHSSWQGAEPRLPRRITPSDGDICFDSSGHVGPAAAVFDNDGRIIFVELSSAHSEWRNVSTGQRRLYENMVRNTQHCAVLCRHSVDAKDERPIDTRYDIGAFQIVLHSADFGLITSLVNAGNAPWQDFVFQWFDDPAKLRRSLIRKYWNQRS